MTIVAEMGVDALADHGVTSAWGVVGDALNLITDATRRDDRVEWVGVRHGDPAAFAAGAQAQLTGRLGLCMGTVGPGSIHLLNGLYDAKKSHAPVLAICGQVPTEEIGSNFFQEVNNDVLFSDVAVFAHTVTSASQMPQLLEQAVNAAMAEQGVPGAAKALDDADVIFLVGADFPYRDWYPEGKTVIQLDMRGGHIGRRTQVDHALVGHVLPTRSFPRTREVPPPATPACRRCGSPDSSPSPDGVACWVRTAVATSMGLKGVRVTSPDDLDSAVQEALAAREPVLLDVVTNPDEVSLPPKLTPAEAWGFAIAKAKETIESR